MQGYFLYDIFTHFIYIVIANLFNERMHNYEQEEQQGFDVEDSYGYYEDDEEQGFDVEDDYGYYEDEEEQENDCNQGASSKSRCECKDLASRWNEKAVCSHIITVDFALLDQLNSYNEEPDC